MRRINWLSGCSAGLLLLLVGGAGCGSNKPEPELCATTAECDDQNICTDDICEEGICQHQANEATCSDGDSCTVDDRCQSGVCQGVLLDADGDGFAWAQCGGEDCDDRDPGVNPNVMEGPQGDWTCSDGIDNDCDGLTDADAPRCGSCQSDLDCDDGRSCNGQETCQDGICLAGVPVNCQDGDPCTDDLCQESGGCAHPFNHNPCDDGDACTFPDVCSEGLCQAGPLADRDEDGAADVLCGGTDCNDLRAGVAPGLSEGAGAGNCLDGLDNDCDGLTDSQEADCSGVSDDYADVDGLVNDALRNALLDRIDNHSAMSYDGAKQWMFSTLDNEGGRVQCVYTGEWVTTTGIPDNDLMNTEHTWCQSWGADTVPAKSDLFHLFPALSAANSRRSNLEFGEVVNSTWTMGGSVLGDDLRGQRVFEPREAHKGDAARALFYFSVRYEMSIDDYMEATLRIWNAEDPPDAKETRRCDDIESVQHNRNPFIDRPGFVDAIDDF